jgi:hypothetical protein
MTLTPSVRLRFWVALGITALLTSCVMVVRAWAAQTYAGQIDQGGYHLPPGVVTVQWSRPGSTPQSRPMNPGAPCASMSDPSCVVRWGDSDGALTGWQTAPAYSSEHQGGTVYATVAELYRQAGLSRGPTYQEWTDFGLANSNGRAVWGCAEYEGFTGNRNDPSCGGPRPTPTPRPSPTPPCCTTMAGWTCPCPTPEPSPTPVVTPTPGPTPEPPRPCPTCRQSVVVEFTQACIRALDQLAAGKQNGPNRTAGAGECRSTIAKNPKLYAPGIRTSGVTDQCLEVKP